MSCASRLISSVPVLARLAWLRRFALCMGMLAAALTAAVPVAWAGSSTTTTLTVTAGGSNVTSVASGTIVTLTATVVSGSTKVNPGQVRFCDASAKYCEDSALLATVQLTSSGTATYKFRPGIGSHSYQAVFVATNSYAKSTSNAAALTVTFSGKYPTVTTIAASGTTGDYTLTASVVGAGSQTVSPTGEVSFLDTTNNNASLGSAELGIATAEQAFITGPAPDVGSNPGVVAIGDFNGDGIPDLAIGGNSVTILLGSADGTFTTAPGIDLPSAALAPFFIAVGDFNGDGILDLAISNSNTRNLNIFLGNGDGTFTVGSSPGTYVVQVFMVVGDFNGDGILDLATANYIGQVRMLFGNGDGTFTTSPTTYINQGTGSTNTIAVGDFNGDGNLDLAVSSGTILLGNGDGTFTPASTTIPGFSNAVVGDFNGDGVPDLAITNNPYDSPGSVTVLLGKGNGTFTTGSTLTVGNKTSAITAGDFKGDGVLDLATANSADNTVTVLIGKGDGTFPTQSTLNVGSAPDGIAAADFTGDGITDLAIANSGDSTLSMLLSELTETATATLNNVSVSGAGTHLIAASYPSDAQFSGSTSDTLALTTSQTSTTLDLSSSVNPSSVGSPIILTAVLMPSSSISSTTNGETVTFYNNGVSIGTSTLFSGVAMLYFTPRIVGSTRLTASFAGNGNFLSATSNSLIEVVTIASANTTYIVTTNTDTTNGVAANCTGAGSSNCSLRDALAAAGATGTGGNITFSPAVFATPQTIALVNGTLNVPSNTTITGPTKGSGATLTNLVTVSGGGPVFTVNSGVANASISDLTITGGSTGNEGGGIYNGGTLTVTNSTISGNSANGEFSQGGGIENFGVLALINSTVTGNNVSLFTVGCGFGCGVQGGGIDNGGTLTLINSTVSGNTATLQINYNGSVSGIIAATGGGIDNYGTLTMTNSTVTGNSVSATGVVNNPGLSVDLSGGGIEGNATGANNIISGNSNSGSEDDCDGTCPTSGQNGNLVGAGVQLAAFGSYGGPTQTAPPLPGSTAICAGVIADIPSGTTTDQRGFPRTTTYDSNPPCVDSGSVQTNYSLTFSTEPPSTIPATTSFTAAVQVNESGNAFPVSGISIPFALAAGDNGSLNVTGLTTNSSGVASDDQLQISVPGNDKLVATLPITSPGTKPAIATSASSTAIDVTKSAGIEVTVGVSPAGPVFMVDGVSYTAATTLVWPVGSQHTLSAVSPQGSAGTQYTFASWSDGGAITHTVTASTSTIDYTVAFNTSYLLTTSANPSKDGTVSPVTGYFPANSVVALTATANPGYTFTNWNGNAGESVPSITVQMTAPQSVTANFTTIPVYTVNTNVDDSTGVAANCTSSGSACSLRDALAAAAAATSGADIEFDSTVFAASKPASARTIVLGSGGNLNISGNTRVFGPTTGSGATLTQLVTVNGKNLSYVPIFSATGGVLSGLEITGDTNGGSTAGGIYVNSGALTVMNCRISGNGASQGGGIANYGGLTVIDSTISGNTGGGIYNNFALTVIDSTISGNPGGGIYAGGIIPGLYAGNITIINSTISGNSGTGIVADGGVDQSVGPQSLTISNSTISGNTSGGVNVQEGIDLNSNNPIPVALTVRDSVLSGNTTNGGEDDCDQTGTTCPTSGQNGNLVGAGVQLAPLANYGGPTQTQPPLPGSTAICAGVVADIPTGITTDQRGFPRTTTYGTNPPCIDSGSVQTNYSLRFSTEPPETVAPNTDFTAGVQLSESSNPFSVSGIIIPLTLGAGSTGSLSGGSAATGNNGVAIYPSLQVNAEGYPETLVATLPLTASGITPAAASAATSSAFDVIQSGNPAATPVLSLRSGAYTNSTVTITDATPGATIYYTINRGTPTTSSTVYTKPIALNSPGTFTIQAIAVASGYGLSAVASATYTITPGLARPVFTPAAGSYTTPQTVTISDISTKTIYYTTDGSMPTTSSPQYAGPITVSANESIKAIAVLSGFTNSPVASAGYIIEPQLPTPTIGPAPGTYTSTMVTITDATPDVTIYYALDGIMPTTAFPVYKGPVLLNHPGSYDVRAIAVANGYINSEAASAVYTIRPVLARPVFTPAAGSYTTPRTVTISDISTKTIYYTTDGSMPTTSSPQYNGPITVSANETIKAIAVLSGYVNSPVNSASYTIGP